MGHVEQALSGALRAQPLPLQTLPSLLVVGGGGTLGSALLSDALAAGRFERVYALVAEPLKSALRGLQALPAQALLNPALLLASTALIVFERPRRSNGRDDAFVQPSPDQLPALAQSLFERSVGRLLVVLPHAPALLPQALAHGLANLDEAAVAALGFEHLVFVRAAQSALTKPQGSRLRRFAQWWLSQLALMVPQRQQPLRTVTLARCIIELARLLPRLAPGTRVIAPETLWQWGQHSEDLEQALIQALKISAQAAPP